jgi:hypothetical protein
MMKVEGGGNELGFTEEEDVGWAGKVQCWCSQRTGGERENLFAF